LNDALRQGKAHAGSRRLERICSRVYRNDEKRSGGNRVFHISDNDRDAIANLAYGVIEGEACRRRSSLLHEAVVFFIRRLRSRVAITD